MANVDARPAGEFQVAWNCGWMGEPCPEPPADLDYWQVDGWLAAYQKGREDAAAGRRKEADRLEAFFDARAGSVTAEQRMLDRQSLEGARAAADRAEVWAAAGRRR